MQKLSNQWALCSVLVVHWLGDVFGKVNHTFLSEINGNYVTDNIKKEKKDGFFCVSSSIGLSLYADYMQQ